MSTLFILQDICNGIGTCGCDGTCDCPDPPYSGDFCELCSGDDICFDSNCDSNRDCANCILDLIAPAIDTISVDEYFTNASVLSELPEGSVLMFDMINNANVTVLPGPTCMSVCGSGAVIISGTENTDYIIDGKNVLTTTLSLP